MWVILWYVEDWYSGESSGIWKGPWDEIGI